MICHADRIGILSMIDGKKGIARPTLACNLFCVTSPITGGNLRHSTTAAEMPVTKQQGINRTEKYWRAVPPRLYQTYRP